MPIADEYMLQFWRFRRSLPFVIKYYLCCCCTSIQHASMEYIENSTGNQQQWDWPTHKIETNTVSNESVAARQISFPVANKRPTRLSGRVFQRVRPTSRMNQQKYKESQAYSPRCTSTLYCCSHARETRCVEYVWSI